MTNVHPSSSKRARVAMMDRRVIDAARAVGRLP
jgi:hypothetical protein